MYVGAVVGAKRVRCAECGHLNLPFAEWCEECLVDFGPAERRVKRPARTPARPPRDPERRDPVPA